MIRAATKSVKKFLDAPRIRDVVSLLGGKRANKRRLQMPDGSPVTVEHIMAQWGVSRDYAEGVVRRNS